MAIDHSDKFYVLSVDLGLNSIESSDILTSSTMLSRIGMYGESMFGDVLILGTGSISTYHTDSGKNVFVEDGSLSIQRLPVILYVVTMSSAMGMWGSAMFGSDDILGTGSLNVDYG